MPISSPFHPRTSELNTAMRWKDWAGYHAVCSYDTYHEREYFAFRHAAGLIDVTPLFKYEVRGPDSAAFLSRVMVRNIAKLKVGQVSYCCWCDHQGKVLDDGTVWRIDDAHYRVTSAEPAFRWLNHNARGFDVTIADISDKIAALSLQGPNAREILKSAADADVESLRFFRLTQARINGFDAIITRTGYTGDLGYEIWVANEHATALWDVLIEAGTPFGMLPAGLDAMDMTRIEAGFILNGIDYFPANHCLIEPRKSTPYELGLGWTVHLDREPFNGQAALEAEKKRGPARHFVCLDIDWDQTERLYARHDLPPEICSSAWRNAVPVYDGDGIRGKQIGQATSGAWSPTLKKNLALATVKAGYEKVGAALQIEHTVEYERHTVKATVINRPAFDPPRKKS
ncbi:MAG: aminomethyl transferase family protein [Planctomycetes bacterium]|nr:aminomethyl transferase family protein [Planctomycetota bacterium]